MKKQSRQHSLLLINIIYYLLKNSFLHFVHVGWQSNCKQFTNQGVCGKTWGRQPGKEERHARSCIPHLHHTARQPRMPREPSAATRDFFFNFLEKELHRKYSKKELYHNERSVPYLKIQGRWSFIWKTDGKAQNFSLTFLQLKLSWGGQCVWKWGGGQQVGDTASPTPRAGIGYLQKKAKRKVTNLFQLNIKLNK